MDDRMKELVAIGAAAAVNCHPCMTHHLGKCREAGASREDIVAAVEVGMMVNRGAAGKTRAFVAELLGEAAKQPPKPEAGAMVSGV